jgi:hypothetical protein
VTLSTSVREQMEILKQLVVSDEEIRRLDLELGTEREALEGIKKDLVRVREKIEQERAQYESSSSSSNDRGRS